LEQLQAEIKKLPIRPKIIETSKLAEANDSFIHGDRTHRNSDAFVLHASKCIAENRCSRSKSDKCCAMRISIIFDAEN
jgi:hypothetical protein